MYPRVTAVLVARNGAAYLERTLAALRAQTRQPDATVFVDGGSKDGTGELLAAWGPTQLVQVAENLSFGQAVARATRVMQSPQGQDEWLWLLAQDSAPEPGALAALLGAVEVAPSVAVAGPKVMDWTRSGYLRSYGESITRAGTTVHLVEDELDQGQHDSSPDVLAVAAGGMLVRHTLWEELGGFDPGLPVVDDALDFSIRTRLAGHRVSRVPDARVTTARIGLQRPDGRRIDSGERRRARQQRAAELHRRLAYSSAPLLLVHWLSLVPFAIGRAILRLLRKQPGLVGGELLAAIVVAFGGTKVLRARRALRSAKNVGWKAIAPLRIPLDVVRQLRSVRHDAVRVQAGRERHPLQFFQGGGVWVVLLAALVGLVLYTPLLAAPAISGGGLLTLSPEVGELWRNAAYGWRDIGTGFVGAADPFAAVLAVLGSVTFWSPSFSMVLLYLTALPLAAMGAWLMIARITPRTLARAAGALVYVLAPAFFAAQVDGRPGPMLAHVLLPWLFFAGFGASRSWSASASASLLAAAVVACAPVLAVPLAAVWIVVVVTSGRRVGRFLGLPIPALALLFPLILARAPRGEWLALLADPGVPLPSSTSDFFTLLAGFPSGLPGAGQPGGWVGFLEGLNIPASAAPLATAVLVLPLILAAVAALLLPNNLSALGGVGLASAGLVTATLAQGVQLATAGSATVAVWSGTGLSLYWLGLVIGFSLSIAALPSFRLVPALLVMAAVAAVVSPLAAVFPSGQSPVTVASERSLPAYVAAEAQNDPRIGTIVLVPQADGGILARLERGSGATLDQQSTLVSTGAERNDSLDELAGNLVSRSGFDVASSIQELGVRFVVLAQPQGAQAGDAASAVRSRAAVSLDADPTFSAVGDTRYGLLWSAVDTSNTRSEAAPSGVIGPFGLAYTIGVLLIFLVALLLAVPTGLSLERGRSADAVAGIDDEPGEATGQFDDGNDDV
ncbi:MULTISPECIES: glycosyltransferase family 2 protein [unclassified Rathayibacter]|uniref:glycosyltransferase family 2 protein n=1 Tax=unclassified Rathayibacter TaxID=2609250 RepID=UPI00188BCBCF|nr:MULTISPECIES: glycosyltransferase family 2 protein [unclassified Rathayibacter]MBF4463357.1 glycosyltransferase family 2 protein [Rathayibacter sp. VKM Ac-2879]MBF4504920.1 glycosyltransferase family 2 protein [Rathayibacter sp. VKM Ac-2878]